MATFLSRLFVKSAPAAPEPVLYKDCRITPAPMQEAGGWRVAARIEREVDGALKVHQLIRADVHATRDSATEASLDKARQAIDQLGEGLFR
jgi:hypothetical protein